jgi:hypothetical protein
VASGRTVIRYVEAVRVLLKRQPYLVDGGVSLLLRLSNLSSGVRVGAEACAQPRYPGLGAVNIWGVAAVGIVAAPADVTIDVIGVAIAASVPVILWLGTGSPMTSGDGCVVVSRPWLTVRSIGGSVRRGSSSACHSRLARVFDQPSTVSTP